PPSAAHALLPVPRREPGPTVAASGLATARRTEDPAASIVELVVLIAAAFAGDQIDRLPLVGVAIDRARRIGDRLALERLDPFREPGRKSACFPILPSRHRHAADQQGQRRASHESSKGPTFTRPRVPKNSTDFG